MRCRMGEYMWVFVCEKWRKRKEERKNIRDDIHKACIHICAVGKAYEREGGNVRGREQVERKKNGSKSQNWFLFTLRRP